MLSTKNDEMLPIINAQIWIRFFTMIAFVAAIIAIVVVAFRFSPPQEVISGRAAEAYRELCDRADCNKLQEKDVGKMTDVQKLTESLCCKSGR